MGSLDGLDLRRAAFASFFLWALTWLAAFALGLAGRPFGYLFFSIAEPLILALVLLAPANSSAAAWTIVIGVVLQGALGVLQFVLRIFLISLPFTSSQAGNIFFLLLNGVSVVVYALYVVEALGYKDLVARRQASRRKLDSQSNDD